MWRAGLPIRVNLVRRKLLTDSICPQCKKGPEHTLHALWTCPLLSTVWQVVFSDLVAISRSCSSFLNVIQLAQQNKSRLDLFAWMVSLIWHRRNKLHLEEDAIPIQKISPMASDALQEYHQLCPTHAKIPHKARVVKWRPP